MKYQREFLRYVYPNQRNSTGLGNCCEVYGIELTGYADYRIFYWNLDHYKTIGPYHFFQENSDGVNYKEGNLMRFWWFYAMKMNKR